MPQWKNISSSWGTEEEWKPISNSWGGEPEPTRYDTSFNPTYEDASPQIKKYDTGFSPTYDWTPEESWGHWGVGQLLRTGPSIIGRVGGTLIGGGTGAVAGAPAGGVGAIPGFFTGATLGGMTGDALGSGVGEFLGQWWDGGEYNPEMIGVSAVSGLMPGGNYKIGKGLYELGKYGLKQGAESGAQNLLMTPFSHQAAQGNLFEPSKWEMPSAGEFGTNAATGFAFGGAIGGAAGKYQQGAPGLRKIADNFMYALKGDPSSNTPTGVGRIDPPTPYRNIPTGQDLEFSPTPATAVEILDGTRGEQIIDNVANTLFNEDVRLQNIVRSTDRPTFDVNPFANVQDALIGADIGTRITDAPPIPPPIHGAPNRPTDTPDLGMGGDLLRDPYNSTSTFGAETGGDMVSGGDWSQRPPRQPLRGDEAIPELAFQPDEGKSTNAEFSENFLPGERVDNPTSRQTIDDETRMAPEGNLNAILLSYPELREQALAIYHETNPEIISQNLANYTREREAIWHEFNKAQDAKNRHGTPIPAELNAARDTIFRLAELAQAKYERASSRMVRGISETSGKPRGGLFDAPDQFHQDGQPVDPGMGGDPLRESPTSPTFGHEQGGDMATGGLAQPPDPEGIRAALRKSLGREPSQAEVDAAMLHEQLGVNPSSVPRSPVDVAVGNVLHAYAGNPQLKWTEVVEMLRHLPPGDARRAQTLIMQMVTASRKRGGLNIPDPLESRPLDPAWEETPAEALQEDIPTVSIGGIIDQKKQALRDMSYDPSGMSGWEADMALQRVNRAREVPSGEQPLLGLEEQKPANIAPEPEQVRQSDVLKVATLMEAGMAREAQQIRELHDMYGRPITPQEEVAALAEHYTRMGDTAKASRYNELADRYSAVEQGQQDMFKPNQFEGGTDKMSQEWQDEQSGRIPPKGSLGIRPGFGKASGMVPQLPESPRQAAAVKRQQAVDDVIRHENKARELEKQADAARDTDNPDLEAQYRGAAELYRKQAATANIQFAKDFRGHMKEVERFESMARAREAAGDTEGAARLKAQAENEYLREAGQLELRFRKNFLAQKMHEMGFTLSDKTMHAIDDMDPANLSHALQKDFAELLLSTEHGGKPGLDVRDVPSDRPSLTETHITIRDNNGKAIAHAEMQTHRGTGEGDLINWAVSQDAGMAQQAVLPLAMELEKRGGLVPKGPYSQDTKNFLQRLVDALRSERGATPIFTGGGGGTPPPTPPAPPGGSGGGRRRRPRQAQAGGTIWDKIKDRAGWGQGYKTNKRQRLLARQQMQWIDEALAMPANMTTTGDLSAPGRQGLMLFHTPEFWNAIGAMFKGINPKSFDHIDKQLKNMRIMQSQGTDPKTGKPLPSMAEQWGMKMFAPASQPGPHAKGAASNWLETGRFFNTDIPYLTKAWAKSPAAMIIRASNRAFITFANHLNVNRLQYLADRAQDNSSKAHQGKVRKQGLLGGVNPSEFRFGIGKYMPDIDIGFHDSIDFSTATRGEIKNWRNYADSLDPYNNIELGKELADAVNTLTGHAPLRTHLIPLRGTELNFEKHARLFGRVLFAPGLMASRIRMMMPANYVMASPTVRKQMVGGLFGWAAGYTAGALLLKNAGEALGYDTDINLDSNSADFGKIRIGNYRMDPSGGMLPYLVLYSRLISGYYTSSSTGRTTELGQGYQATTADTLLDRFISNKQEPIFKFATDMLSASEHQPVFMKDRMLQMMAPMLAQDIWEVSKEDPGLIPLSIGTFFGHGGQVYKQGQASTRFTDPKNEWIYAGGGLRGLMFGADFQNQPQKQIGPRKASPRQLGPRQSAPRQATPRQ